MHYDPGVVRSAIAEVIDGKYLDHPNDPVEYFARSVREKQIAKLLDMFSAMTHTCYGAGMLEVQRGVIKVLDLRHLLVGHGT